MPRQYFYFVQGTSKDMAGIMNFIVINIILMTTSSVHKIIMERIHFNMMKQMMGELVDLFIMALHQTSNRC